MADNGNILFDLSELQVGAKLRFAITLPDGKLLASKGDVITAELLRMWSAQGITQALVRQEDLEASSPDSEQEDSGPTGREGKPAKAARPEGQATELEPVDDDDLLRPFDEELKQRMVESYEQASARILDLASGLSSDNPPDCQPVTDCVADFLSGIEQDLSTVLSTLVGDDKALTEHDEQLARRCSKMSLLSVAIAVTLGWPNDDVEALGIAGMLHDLALFEGARESVVAVYGASTDDTSWYQQHPLQSASLLTNVGRVPAEARTVIAQVHESPDGYGYPRAMHDEDIHRGAKVLSVVDAYLTLTANEQRPPLPPAARLVPSDALAYLMHHATQNHFDRQSLRGLVHATSLYPIGTLVELSDQTAAMVMRSTTVPGEPIVRLDEGQGQIVDLRDSGLSIVRPRVVGRGGLRRMRGSQLNTILWQTETE